MNATVAQQNPHPHPNLNDEVPVGPKVGPGSRVSLACLPCRSRHVRCDATKPICERCASEGKSCLYAKSRRGGLDRVALLAAKKKRAEGGNASVVVVLPPQEEGSDPSAHSERSGSVSGNGSMSANGSGDWTGQQNDGVGSTDTLRRFFGDEFIAFGPSTSTPRSTSLRGAGARLVSSPEASWPSDVVTASSAELQSLDITRDIYIDRYYKCFHRCHPFILPRRHLENSLRDASKHAALRPLISIMKYIGSLTIASAQQPSKAISQRLQQWAEAAISEASSPTSPSAASGPPSAWLLVQSHILYSIAMYWQGSPVPSRQHMDSAIQLALEIGMFRREFAAEHSQGNPVLQESMRRTWWQVFTTDACYMAIKRQHTTLAFQIKPTVELPCEEDEYESGNIPTPKTLDDYDAREFAPDDVAFSSFAHFVGAVRDMTTAIKRAESISSESCVSFVTSSKVLEEVDAILDGWMLLVPENKKNMLLKSGEVDEHIFSAYMALHATTVGLHRQFSECHFNPLEQFSSCSVSPSENSLTDSLELTRVHTLKCIKAAESQIRLLAMPARPCSHSPFTVCMLTTGTLALLASCKFLLRGERLAVARDQIRASIGYHKAMAEIWMHAKDNLEEIQMIAREVLAIGIIGSSSSASSQAPGGISMTEVDQLPPPPAIPAMADLGQILSCDKTAISMAGSLDSMQTCWNMSGMQTQMDASSPWWMGESEMP